MSNDTALQIEIKQANRRGRNRRARKQPEPTALAREYRALINQVIAEYADLTEAILYPVIDRAVSEARLQGVRTDSWVDDLDSALNTLIIRQGGNLSRLQQQMAELANRLGQFNQRNFKAITESTLGVNVSLTEPWLNDELRAWANQNVRLVSSVPAQEHTQISRIALEGVRSGRNVRDIQAEIEKQHGLSRNRALTIARTETAKLNSELTERRQKEIGIDTYYWDSSRDERTRESHAVLDGMLCRWDDDTVYSDDNGATWKQRSSIGGYIGKPGEAFSCRCSSSANTEALLERLGI
jgi:SPP1 gp7 family putative phage head morphogenesis protein